MERARRTFNTDFKQRVVEEFLDGRASQAQLCQRYGLSLEPFESGTIPKAA